MSNKDSYLEKTELGLKILERVILSCQFKSGSGHHFRILIRSVIPGSPLWQRSSWRRDCLRFFAQLFTRTKIDCAKSRQVLPPSDVTMMSFRNFDWPFFWPFCLKLQHSFGGQEWLA